MVQDTNGNWRCRFHNPRPGEPCLRYEEMVLHIDYDAADVLLSLGLAEQRPNGIVVFIGELRGGRVLMIVD